MFESGCFKLSVADRKRVNVTPNAGAPSNEGNNNKRIHSCSAVNPLYFLKHLHRTVRERLIESKSVREKGVYNYTPACKNKISNLQGTAEQAVQEITRREGD